MKQIRLDLAQRWKRIQNLSSGLANGISIIFAGLPSDGIHVSYGYERLPAPGEVTHGGIVKFQRLSNVFPNTPRRFNVLYMVSSNYPRNAELLCRIARRKGAKFVWNQDGVAYPAWKPSRWEESNARLAGFLHSADHVFYQSEFSRSSSNQFLGERRGPSEVLYNSVDTDIFCPASTKKRNSGELVLLAAGSKYFFHRIEIPIRTLALVIKFCPDASLIFAGKLHDRLIKPTERLINELNLENHISFIPPFTQEEAPAIFQQCDILVHPKTNDPCPGVVIEAMACGLPIVYSESGGVPELVGEEAGVGVPTELNWKEFILPPPEKWADAVLTLAENLPRYSEAARQRALEYFDLRPWVERHRQVFSELIWTD